jgi:hypothetical protein
MIVIRRTEFDNLFDQFRKDLNKALDALDEELIKAIIAGAEGESYEMDSQVFNRSLNESESYNKILGLCFPRKIICVIPDEKI